jgi:hypothetical protein
MGPPVLGLYGFTGAKKGAAGDGQSECFSRTPPLSVSALPSGNGRRWVEIRVKHSLGVYD